MAVCCGVERTSRFCPDCGEAIPPAHALCKLLKHCQRQARVYEKTRDRYAEQIRNKKEAWYTERYRKNAASTAEKWRTWATELAEMIARDSKAKSTSDKD